MMNRDCLGRFFATLTLTCLVLSAHCGDAVAQLDRDTLAKLKAATAFIKVEGRDFKASGSGFLLGKAEGYGYFVTNSHVLSEDGVRATKIRVVLNSGSSSERLFSADVVGDDASADLAVLRVKADELPDILSSADSPELYETLDVFILGFPFGSALAAGGEHPAITVSKGAVSSIRRTKYDQVMAVQIDGSINPGNSGGPIVTADGKLVGIAVAKLENTQIGFAIPTGVLRRMLLGRVSAVSISAVSDSRFSIEASLIDPLRRVDRCAIVVAPKTTEAAKLRPNAAGAWTRLPKAGTHELKRGRGAFRGTIELPKSTRGHVFQIALIAKGGHVSFTEPGEFPASPKGANLAGASRSAVGSKGGSSGKGWLGGGDGDAAPDTSFRSDESRPTPQAGERDVALKPFKVADFAVTPLDVDAENLTPQIVFGDKGRSVYLLNKTRLLRRISVPEFYETKRIDLKNTCSFLGMSSAGLVVVMDSVQQVAVIDPKSLEVNKQIRVAGVSRVACAPATQVAFAKSSDTMVALDLNKGRVLGSSETRAMKGDPRRVKRTTPYVPGTGLDMLTMTPDGKYLFSEGGIEMLQRMRVSRSNVEVEEFTPRIGQNAQQIVVSPDSMYVAMPSGGGNYPADGHPKVNYGTYIYAVGNLQSPAMAIATGAYPRALAFDPVAGKIYAQNYEKQLIIVNSGGVKEGEYSLTGGKREDVRVMAVHPAGHRLFVLVGRELLWVDLVDYESYQKPKK